MPQIGEVQYYQYNTNGVPTYRAIPWGGNAPYGANPVDINTYITGIQGVISKAKNQIQNGLPAGYTGATYDQSALNQLEQQLAEAQTHAGVNAPGYRDPMYSQFNPNGQPTEANFTPAAAAEAEKNKAALAAAGPTAGQVANGATPLPALQTASSGPAPTPTPAVVVPPTAPAPATPNAIPVPPAGPTSFYLPPTPTPGYAPQTIFDQNGKALDYNAYIAAGGKPDFSNVIKGPVPIAGSNGSQPAFYKPDPNNQTVYNAQGQALDYATYIAQGGKPDFSNVTNGPVPVASANPGSAGNPAGSGTSTPGAAGITTPPVAAPVQTPKDFQQLYADAYAALGLANVKTQFENYNKQLLDLNNEKADKIVVIKNNPWYSEGVKNQELNNLDEKYQLRISNLQGFLTLSNALYQEGLQQAQFLTTGQYNQQQDQLAQKNLEIKSAQEKQAAIQKIANDNELNTPFILDAGTVYRVSDGKGYSNPTEFYKDAGITSFQEAVDKKILGAVDGNIKAAHAQVLDLMGKYGDAGILPTDTLAQATAKLSRSQIYLKDTKISGTGSGSSASSVIKFTPADKQVLLGAGFNAADIVKIQNDLNQYGVDQVVEGMSKSQANAIKKVLGAAVEPEEFLSEEFFKNQYGAGLEAAAKEAGYSESGGGLFGTGLFKGSHPDTASFLKHLMQLVDQYRKSGYNDQEILKMMS